MMTTDESKNVYTDNGIEEELWAVTLQSAEPKAKRSQMAPTVYDIDQPDPMVDEEKPRFKLLTRTDLRAMPDPEWLIHGLLPADSFTVIYGAPGAAKSFMALDMACSVASGHTLHGAQVRRGKTLVAVGEGLRGMKPREEAWSLARGADADMDALEKNLHILPKAVHLLEQKDATMLVNTAEYLSQVDDEPLRLVIIDTWARALVGGDENSAKDVGVAIDVCERIRERTGATVLIVHHTGADGQRERGSTALRGAADTSIAMVKDEASGIINMQVKKMKDGTPPAPSNYILSQYGHSAVLLAHDSNFRPTSVYRKPNNPYNSFSGEPF